MRTRSHTLQASESGQTPTSELRSGRPKEGAHSTLFRLLRAKPTMAWLGCRAIFICKSGSVFRGRLTQRAGTSLN